MNRKTIFKGKREDNGEWIIGNVLQSDEDTYIATSFLAGNADEPLMVAAYKIAPETLCNLTGAIDKKGHDIWEHDIVINKSNNCGDWIGKIVFENGAFVVHWIEYPNLKETGISALTENIKNVQEVIGNIFDNPELLYIK